MFESHIFVFLVTVFVVLLYLLAIVLVFPTQHVREITNVLNASHPRDPRFISDNLNEFCLDLKNNLLYDYRSSVSHKKLIREEAKPHSIPFIISIQEVKNDTNIHLGAGVIIKKNCILTAAHNLDVIAKKKNNFFILAGCHELYSNDDVTHIQRLTIDKIKKHDDYFKNNEGKMNSFDIGLIFTKETIQFTDYVQPIPYAREPESSHSELYFFGWGNISKTLTRVYPSKLQMSVMPMIDHKTCVSLLGPVIDQNRVCAGSLDGRYTICYGDSGGPLIQYVENKPILIGIASYGYDFHKKENLPSLFTRVGEFIEWIKVNSDINNIDK